MLQAALSRPGAGPPIMRARALNALGRLRLMESMYWPETVATLEESLAIFRELGDLDGSAEVLDHLQLVAGYRGDIEQAMALEEASLRDSRAARNPERTAWALANSIIWATSRLCVRMDSAGRLLWKHTGGLPKARLFPRRRRLKHC